MQAGKSLSHKERAMRKTYKVLMLMMLCTSAVCTSVLAKSKKKKDADDKPKATPAPKWVDNPTSVYPASAYFQSVGTGADRASAELAAVQGLASIFKQDVQGTTSASKRMEQAVKDGKVVTTTAAGISQETASRVNLDDVIGVEVVGYWQNVQEGNWLAIAVLDKSKASVMYSSMIKQNDSEARDLINVDEADAKTYFSFETYARFDLAKEIAQKNDGYLERLQVINPQLAASLRGECVSAKQMKSKAIDVAKEIPIGIVVEGDREGRVKAGFAGAVTASGFRTSDKADERYVIKAVLSMEKHETDTTVQCRYNVDAPLQDNALDEVLLPYSTSGREAAKDWDGAQYNTYKALEKKLKGAFTKSFVQYLESVAAY